MKLIESKHHLRNYTGSADKQRGITALGAIILVTFIGLFVYAGMRLVPVYLENMKIAGTFSKLADEFDGQATSRVAILKSMEKRFDVDSVTVISYRDVKVQKTGAGYDLSVEYEHVAPFIANVSFSVKFNNKVSLRR